MNVYASFFASVILFTPVALIVFSYGWIVRVVLRIKSAAGQRKAFGTCGSHLTVVSLFFGTAIYVYYQPISSDSQDQDKFMSLFYTVIIPMTNPLIYTLRNRDVKDQERRAWKAGWAKGNELRTCAVTDGDEAEKAVTGRAVVF